MKIHENELSYRIKTQRPIMLSGFLWLLFTLVSCAGTGELRSVEETSLTGAEILERYTQATGGLEAYDKIQNRITKGTFAIPQIGIQGPLTIYHARPDQVYTLLEIEALGKTESGISGDVAWEMSLAAGPRIKEGNERTDALRDGIFDGYAKWREIYDQVEYAGSAEINGRSCHKVILSPESGNPRTLYFDQETNLLAKVEASVESQMGIIPVESFPEDYMEVAGILLPHTTKTVIMGQERIVTIESVEHNVQMPNGIFELPEEVKALIDN